MSGRVRRLCGGVKACRFGFAGGCGEELKTMGDLVVE